MKEWNLNTLSQVQCIVCVNKLWIVSKHVSQLSDAKMLEIRSYANYKQLLDLGFCDIQNNQGRGRGYQPKLYIIH